MIQAYCYASGLIEFGRKRPDGALPIARGPASQLREFVDAKARHGYRTRKVSGRVTKIPGTDCLLVPGIPEAPDQSAGLDALLAWRNWILEHAPAGVTVWGKPKNPSAGLAELLQRQGVPPAGAGENPVPRSTLKKRRNR